MRLWESIKKRIRDAKFSQKMFAAFFLVSGSTVLLLGFYSWREARDNLFYQEKQSMKEQIWQANTMLDAQFAQYQTVMISLLYNTLVTQCLDTEGIGYFDQYLMFSNTLEPTIDSIVSSHSNILLVKIYTDNETLKGHSKYLYALEELPEEFAGTGRIPMTYRMTEHTLTAVCQFPRGAKELTNVLYVEFRVSDLLHLLQSDGRQLLIADTGGKPVYSGFEVDVSADYAGTEDGSEVSLQGEPFYLFVNEISEVGWKSFCFVPKEGLQGDDTGIWQVTLRHLLLAAALSFFMSALLGRGLIAPLQRLQKSMERVEEGDFTVEVSSEAGDEVGQLTNAFGAMTKKLNVLVNEVYRSQIVQKEAEFKMLQAQLNPHFLYNTLSFINWSALKAGQKEIAKISRDISSFYRTALNSGRTTTTVEEELVNARSYIDIQLMLHRDSFDVEYETDPACASCGIICNVLQPLIENALEHGIDRKREGRGMLGIRVRLQQDILCLEVSDNGPGFEGGVEEEILQKDSPGYGLKNVNDRIRIYYGEGYGLTIESGEETRIKIQIPAVSSDTF